MKKRILPLFLCVALFISGCSDTRIKKEYTVSFFAMDTSITFTVYGKNAESTLVQARQKLTELERLFSVTDINSDIYAINHAGGQAVNVHEETAKLIDFALGISEKTGGALDITIYPVLSAWGFTTDKKRIPSREEISELLPLVGYKNVEKNENTVIVPSGAMIDLGAVAKGYSGDVIAEILSENGITSAFLNLGGNVQTIGKKTDGSDWRVGLKDPVGEGIAGVLRVFDVCVVTSGAYERYFIGEDGKRYGHIVDPESGYPVDNGMMSVTVIAKEGKLCDALSTALFVMGLDRACEYWRENQDFDMILITERGDIYLTEGINGRFTPSYADAQVHVISGEA